MTAKVTSGSTRIGMLAFESTAIQSETGKRLPEENAAIAALRVQRIEAVDHRDEHLDDHQDERDDQKRLLDGFVLLHRAERQRGAHPVRQVYQPDEETGQEDRGDSQRRDVDGAVLPELARAPSQYKRRAGEIIHRCNAAADGDSAIDIRRSVHTVCSLCLARAAGS